MPLLGLTNFIFFMNPGNSRALQSAYRVTNAVLSSSQGIFVAFLYCFIYGEVQRVLKRKWYSFKIRQVLHTSSRRRSSRTSSFFLTSATEVHPLRALRNKMCPALKGHVVCEDASTAANPKIGTVVYMDESDGEPHKSKDCPCVCLWNSDGYKTCCCCSITDLEDGDE